jgi:hypothetical protein
VLQLNPELAPAAVEHDALSEGKTNLDSTEQNRRGNKPHTRKREQKLGEVNFLH